MTIWAIVPAAGIGRRMESNTPKQYRLIHGETVLGHTLKRLSAVSAIERIIVALHPGDSVWPTLSISDSRITVAEGGDERQQTVLNALTSIAGEASEQDWVLVHDAVRPCVLPTDIEKLIVQLSDSAVGGLLGNEADNTLKEIDDENKIVKTVDRSSVWNAFTPQMFRYSMLLNAITAAEKSGTATTDEASAIELAGHSPVMIAGAKTNIKITHESDLAMAGKILELQAHESGSLNLSSSNASPPEVSPPKTKGSS